MYDFRNYTFNVRFYLFYSDIFIFGLFLETSFNILNQILFYYH